MADFLKCINSPRHIENIESFRTLSEIIKYSLTAFIHEKDENYKIVYAVLHVSQLLYHVK